jgi:hypothetical protein
VETYRNPLDQVPQLGEDVLREQCALVRERVDVPTDRLIRALDLLANRGHLVLMCLAFSGQLLDG